MVGGVFASSSTYLPWGKGTTNIPNHPGVSRNFAFKKEINENIVSGTKFFPYLIPLMI
jgi:hypothetical protein